MAADPPKTLPAAKPLAQSSPPKAAKTPASKTPPVTNTPVDLLGVTLTGGDGTGWSSMTGNGLAMDTPIRPTVATSASAVPVPSASAKIVRPLPPPIEVVPLKDLATKPRPPALNASLVANYPPLAKRQGLAGNAKLLVRIDADGVVRQCTVQSASSAEFGAACRQTLLGSRWSTPRDRLGKAVVTQVHYTCDFRVNGS
jgi:TonB family protein